MYLNRIVEPFYNSSSGIWAKCCGIFLFEIEMKSFKIQAAITLFFKLLVERIKNEINRWIGQYRQRV